MLDQVRKFIPAWQRGLIQRPGRLVLVKLVVAARSIHQLMVLDVQAWVFEEIDKWMMSFFWAGKEHANSGQCLVAWDTICRPTCFCGLDVKDLLLQALALWVHCEWLRRMDPERLWQGVLMMVDQQARLVFDSLVNNLIPRWALGTRCSFGRIAGSIDSGHSSHPFFCETSK